MILFTNTDLESTKQAGACGERCGFHSQASDLNHSALSVDDEKVRALVMNCKTLDFVFLCPLLTCMLKTCVLTILVVEAIG